MFRSERVADELRAVMARKKIGLTRLSEATGIPKSTLSRKVNGLSEFTVSEFLAASSALGVSAADVLVDAGPVSTSGSAA